MFLLFSCVSVNGIITHPFTQAINLGIILNTSLLLTSLIHSPRCPVNSVLYLSTPALPPQNYSSSLPTGLPSIHPVLLQLLSHPGAKVTFQKMQTWISFFLDYILKWLPISFFNSTYKALCEHGKLFCIKLRSSSTGMSESFSVAPICFHWPLMYLAEVPGIHLGCCMESLSPLPNEIAVKIR